MLLMMFAIFWDTQHFFQPRPVLVSMNLSLQFGQILFFFSDSSMSRSRGNVLVVLPFGFTSQLLIKELLCNGIACLGTQDMFIILNLE